MNTFYLKTVVIWFPKFVAIMVVRIFWIASVFFIVCGPSSTFYLEEKNISN